MRSLRYLAFFLALAMAASQAYAAELAQPGTPARKLQRGFLNLALSPFELSHQLSLEKKNNDAVPSWMPGIGKGFLYAVGRATTGVVEMLTFFVPAPANYAPILQPEMPWELLPEIKENTAKK